MPYSPDTVFTKQFPYEGFTNIEYSNNNSNNSQSDSAVDNKLISGQNAGDCKKVYGFDGLFCKPYTPDAKVDKFSDAKGDASCFGQSSGLSNSKGSLCLGSDLTYLLQTRGGNQTGKPDQYA
jgi:hypothetical protein